MVLSFVRIGGQRAKMQTQLSKFKSDPTVHVLLLPVQRGANGYDKGIEE